MRAGKFSLKQGDGAKISECNNASKPARQLFNRKYENLERRQHEDFVL